MTGSAGYNHCAEAFQYAADVLDGKILACRYVKLACERFERDLDRDDLVFDYDKAERFIRYFEQLPHVKGEWARRGERIKLQPWQKFKFASIFGFYKYQKDGTLRRKYRECYNEIPRKNGKSIDAAGVGNFMAALDGEYAAEVFCGATSEKQANEVFNPAKQMLLRDPELREFMGMEKPMTKSIYRMSDGSSFRPVIGDPPDGPSPNCGIVDEYHEHKHDKVYKTFQTGMGARENPLLYVITTAGDNIGGPCHEKRIECVQILEGLITDSHADSTFVLIYTIDDDRGEDFWKTEDALKMANPNYGVSISSEWLRTQQEQAIRSVKDQGFFKTKHLNLWVNESQPFINYEDWKKCADPTMKIEDFVTYPCKMGVDLSSRIDFTASCKVFYNDDMDGKRHYYLFPEFWLPGEGENDYRKWAEYINFTDGNEIDTLAVKTKLTEDAMNYMMEEVTFDPWKSAGFEQELENAGIEITKFPQTVGHYTMPMNEVEAAIMSGRLHHPDNPVLNWMLSNLRVKRDTNGNCKPRKEDNNKKIDGMVAAIMAVGRCMSDENETFSAEILRL